MQPSRRKVGVSLDTIGDLDLLSTAIHRTADRMPVEQATFLASALPPIHTIVFNHEHFQRNHPQQHGEANPAPVDLDEAQVAIASAFYAIAGATHRDKLVRNACKTAIKEMHAHLTMSRELQTEATQAGHSQNPSQKHND